MDSSALLQKSSEKQSKHVKNDALVNCMPCLSLFFLLCFWRIPLFVRIS